MTYQKYKKILIPYIIILSSILLLSVLSQDVFNEYSRGFSKVIPLPTQGTQTLWIISFSIISGIIGAYIGGYAIGPVFLFLHKKIIGRKMIYGFQNKEQSDQFKGYYIKALFPALLAVHFCLLFSANVDIQELVVYHENSSAVTQMMTFSVLLPIFLGIGLGIFAPTWFLLDGSIIYTNKKKVEKLSDPIEIRSVGGWYIYLLKGYAGISVFITYYDFFSRLITEVDINASSLMLILLWPIMPLFLAYLMISVIIILDKTFDKRRKYIRKWANKFGITEPLDFDLDREK
ncbi:MAG: hypothetical protein JXA99_08350 [Candidatus Lokiarchaeota archaeon]|nr:hypothetical protein [Candidatus Lokiarchaeota archaeon]